MIGGLVQRKITRANNLSSLEYDFKEFERWSEWINPVNIFKNLTIIPFFEILIILVLINVPGYTYWSNYIFFIYYS